jgi:hypothetical protein
MTKSYCWLLCGALFTGWIGTALAAGSADLERSRATFSQAESHLKAKRYQEARDGFLEVLKVVEVPKVAYNAAQAHEGLGELHAAVALYQRATQLQQNELWADKATQLNAQKDALAALTALNERIPTLRLEIHGDVTTVTSVTVDDQPRDPIAAPLLLDPGRHKVVVSTSTRSMITKFVTLSERQQEILTIELAELTTAPPPATTPVAPNAPAAVGTPRPLAASEPASPTSPPPTTKQPSNTIGWIGIGVGAAGLALGATAGIVSLVKRSDMNSAGCNDGACPASVYDSKDASYDNWRKVATVGFVVGGVATAAGVTWILVQRHRESSPRVGISLGAIALDIHGRF